MKHSDIYNMKDGLHELGIMGKKRVIRGQTVCKDSWGVNEGKIYANVQENDKKTFHLNVPRTFPPNVL